MKHDNDITPEQRDKIFKDAKLETKILEKERKKQKRREMKAKICMYFIQHTSNFQLNYMYV